MSRLLIDLRIALRVLLKTPAMTVPAILVLGIGIGATTAVFSVADHVLFRPLRLPDADRLVTICETHADRPDYCTASTPNVHDWAARARSFQALGAGRSWPFMHERDEGGREIEGGYADGAFFAALGVPPARGRLIGPDDLPPRGDGRVAVLSDAFARATYGDRDPLGQTIVLDKKPHVIVGVLPRGLDVPRLDGIQLWLPLAWDPADEDRREWRGFVAVGKLAPGVSTQAAQAELRAINAGLEQEHPDALRGWRVEVERMQDRVVGRLRPTLLVFLAAVALVLVLVCVNVAALLLARATAREREMAMRFALGARGGHLASQALAESALLALFGGALGMLVATWAVDAFKALAPPGLPRIDEVVVDARVFGFTFVVMLVCALLFALVPLGRVRGVEAVQVFRAGRSISAGRRAGRVRQAMVGAELAIALVLLTGTALLLESFAGLLEWQPGFDTERLMTFSVFVSEGKYPRRDSVLQVYRRAEESLASIPGVVSVSTASAGPLFGGGDGQAQFVIDGRRTPSREEAPWAAWFDVGPGYFRTLGIPLRRGRFFTEADDRSTPLVVLINDTMARRFWPGGDPVGSRLHLFEFNDDVEVVGVVGDVPPFQRGTAPQPEFYFTNRQATRWATFFVLRTSGEPSSLASVVTARLREIDRDLLPGAMRTLPELISRELVRPRFNMLLVGLFAVIALVLAAIGVYGVIAYAVEMRTQEIGIRLALGATPRQIVAGTLWTVSGLLAGGAVVGLIGSLAFARVLQSMLYGVSPRDPKALASAVLLLVGCAVLAALRPAFRASRIDPAVSLRTE